MINKESEIHAILNTLHPMFQKISNLNKKTRDDNIKFIRDGGKRYNNVDVVIDHNVFNSKTLCVIGRYIKYCVQHNNVRYNLSINFLNVDYFKDKVVYIIFDMMIFYFLNMCKNSTVKLFYDIEHNYGSFGLNSCAFIQYGRLFDDPYIHRERFNQLFLEQKKTKLFGTDSYYRYMYVSRFDQEKDLELTSKISTDIGYTLNKQITDSSWINDVCRVIEEIVDNAISHNNEMFILDVHFSSDLSEADSKEKDNQRYRGIYITMVNFGSNTLYSQISYKVKNRVYPEEDKLYSRVYSACKNHRKFFKDNPLYNENLFFMITSFQKHVTSRHDTWDNSGIGLTTIINKISGNIYNECYVLSGNDIIFFIDDFIGMSEDGLIGFNKEVDYINMAPDKNCINSSSLYCPGTVYHLNLINENKELTEEVFYEEN